MQSMPNDRVEETWMQKEIIREEELIKQQKHKGMVYSKY